MEWTKCGQRAKPEKGNNYYLIGQICQAVVVAVPPDSGQFAPYNSRASSQRDTNATD
jgi:hypothetical protein